MPLLFILFTCLGLGWSVVISASTRVFSARSQSEHWPHGQGWDVVGLMQFFCLVSMGVSFRPPKSIIVIFFGVDIAKVILADIIKNFLGQHQWCFNLISNTIYFLLKSTEIIFRVIFRLTS